MPTENRSSKHEFEQLPLAELQQGRRGKHHELMNKIADEMVGLPDGSALKIPLDGTSVSLSNLRSALTRAMTTRGVRIATYCDGENLFVWKKTAQTARYERKPRHG